MAPLRENEAISNRYESHNMQMVLYRTDMSWIFNNRGYIEPIWIGNLTTEHISNRYDIGINKRKQIERM